MSNYVSLSEHQVLEIIRCARDPWYCLQNYVWLEREASQTLSTIPFEPFEKQRWILTMLLLGKNILLNKSRRVGWSWIIAFFVWWLINFKKGIKVLLLSRTESDAEILLEKVKFIHRTLAKRDYDSHDLCEPATWMAGEIIVNNKSTFSRAFRNVAGEIVSQSTVVSLTNTDNSGRGRGATFVLMDEFAFYENDTLLWRSISKTIIGGGHWAVGSTPNGIGNRFHWLVMRAMQKLNFKPNGEKEFEFETFHWSESWIDPDEVHADKGLSDEDGARQEWELEFVTTGKSAFDPTHLAACYKPPDEFPEVAQEIEMWRQRILNPPRGERRQGYASGADTALGKIHKKSDEKDWHNFTALTPSGIQAFSYFSQEPLSEWAGYREEGQDGRSYWITGTLTQLHRDWPGLLYIEEDGAGQATKLNHQVPLDGISDIRGWVAGGRGKNDAVLWLKTLIEKHQIVITNETTYRQLMLYQDNGPGKDRWSAPAGYNDDGVTGIMVAAQALQEMGGRVFTWGASAVDATRESITGNLNSAPAKERANGHRGPVLMPDTRRLADMIEGPGQLEVPDMPDGWDETEMLGESMRAPFRHIVEGDFDDYM